MQRQNMIFIFFIAFLLIIFLGYLFVIGGQSSNDKGVSEKIEEDVGECNFSKLYNLLLVTESEDQEYVYVTLREYQVDDVRTVLVKKEDMPSLKKGNYYLFNFNTDRKIHNYIEEIFEESELLEVIDKGKEVSITDGICASHLIEE